MHDRILNGRILPGANPEHGCNSAELPKHRSYVTGALTENIPGDESLPGPLSRQNLGDEPSFRDLFCLDGF